MWYDVRRALERDISLVQKQLVQYHLGRQQRTIEETVNNAPGVPLGQNQLLQYTQYSIMRNI